MITLCLQRKRKTIFAAISPEMHKQVREFTAIKDISTQELLNLVYNRFGNISQESIAKYLQESGIQIE